MSWEVGEDEWLAEPSAIPGSGAIDELDERVLSALPSIAAGVASGGDAAEPGQAPAAAPGPRGAAPELTPEVAGDAPASPPSEEILPPAQDERGPDENGDSADPAPAPAEQSAPLEREAGTGELSVEIVPASADAESTVSEPTEPVEGFHIPTLSLGAQTPAEAAVPEAPSEPEAPGESGDAPGESGDAGFVIPTLSRPAAVDEAAVPEAPSSVGASVYDDDDDDDDDDAARTQADAQPEARVEGQPEALERVDSSELELLDDAEPSPEPDAGFVIPTLARPAGDEEVEVVAPVADAEPAAPADPAEPAEPQEEEAAGVVIPSLTRAEPAAEEVEEVEEVEAIESLDTADLVEVDQAEAVEEPKPPTPPPEAKAQAKRRKGWYDDVFAEHFLFLFPPTWEETASRDARFIHDLLSLGEGGRVLDVGCGDGRHAIELAKLGLQVTGLDNSLALLLAAAQTKEAAGMEDGQVEFLHGDMRRLPRDRDFDAVTCVGTTFGYFEEEHNRQCLQEMYDRVAVGGRLLLHVFNRDFVAPHLPARSWWQGKRCMVIDEAEMNFFANRLRVHRTVIFDDGRQYEHYMFMRAYTVQDLGKAMSQMGMRVLEVSGSRDTRGRFYGSASPDIWIVAEKK